MGLCAAWRMLSSPSVNDAETGGDFPHQTDLNVCQLFSSMHLTHLERIIRCGFKALFQNVLFKRY